MLFALPDDPAGGDATRAPAPEEGGDALSVQDLLKDKKEYDAMAKVELDLEDAPFLAEEKAPEPEKKEAAAGKDAPALDDAGLESEKKESRLKKILRPKIAIPVFALIAAAIGAGFFFLKPGEKPAEEAVVRLDTTQEPESVLELQEPMEFSISFDPFWVEQTAPDGATRFLIFKFSASTGEEKVQWEAKQKILILRDAVFYYLRHKNLTFLSDSDNANVMKRDILGILNGQLSLGALDNLLIESYLVK